MKMSKKKEIVEPLKKSEEKQEFGGLLNLLSNASEESSDVSRIVDSLLDTTKNMKVKTNIKNPHKFALAEVLASYFADGTTPNTENLIRDYISNRIIYSVSKKGDARHAVEKIGANASRNIPTDDEKVGFMDKLRRR
jgi:hypothetical protein